MHNHYSQLRIKMKMCEYSKWERIRCGQLLYDDCEMHLLATNGINRLDAAHQNILGIVRFLVYGINLCT